MKTKKCYMYTLSPEGREWPQRIQNHSLTKTPGKSISQLASSFKRVCSVCLCYGRTSSHWTRQKTSNIQMLGNPVLFPAPFLAHPLSPSLASAVGFRVLAPTETTLDSQQLLCCGFVNSHNHSLETPQGGDQYCKCIFLFLPALILCHF